MEQVYEYRVYPNRKTTWFAACCVGFLLGYGVLTSDPRIFGLVWAMIAMCLIWLLMKSPAAGIRIDGENLTLAAWRAPKSVPLSDIDYLEIQHWTDRSDVRLVCYDGREEIIPFGDLPEMDTFSEVMVAFGLRLREPVQDFSR